MNVLAIETTTDICSVALVTDGCWFEDTRSAPRLHNRHVLAMIDNILEAAEITRGQIGVIAFGAGPGSFTGVRIAAAVAQGVALAVGARALAVPSSTVAAECVRRSSARRGEVTVARPCRPGLHHVSRFMLAQDNVDCLEFDRVAVVDTSSTEVVDAARLSPSARVVGQLALDGIDAAVAPALALPFYVEGDSPWRAVEGA